MPFDIKLKSEFIQACASGDEKLIEVLLIKDATLINKP